MHFMSLLNVSWFALYRQLDWFKISISVLSANREIEMKHHNWLFTNCFYWLKKTVYGPTYWSTGIFIQLFPMRRECLWQHAAAWRKGAVPSVLFLRVLCGRFKPSRWKPLNTLVTIALFLGRGDDIHRIFVSYRSCRATTSYLLCGW